MDWRTVTDWAKRRPATLRLADRLGRGRGRFRVLDKISRLAPAPNVPDLAGWQSAALGACWIGHATVLIRVGGMTILTDPAFSNRVGLSLGLATGGPRRLVAPALSIRQLPPVDLILISHAHFDHLDRPSLGSLPKNVPVVTAPHTSDLIADLGFKSVTELKWHERTQVGPLSITAQPVRHWGARTFYDQHRGYNAYLITSPEHRVLFGGDSAHHEGFRSLAPVDLAILGIGAYHPYVAAHATPEQAWAMANDVQAKFIVPIHHSTFRLGHEPTTEPMERLLRIAGAESSRIVTSEIGQVWIDGA